MGAAATSLADNVDKEHERSRMKGPRSYAPVSRNQVTRAEQEQGLTVIDKLLRVAIDQSMLPHDLSDIDDRLQVLHDELARCEAMLADEHTGRGLVAERKIRARVERYRIESQPIRFLRLRLALMRTHLGDASRCDVGMEQP